MNNTRTLRSVFLTATLFAFAVCLGCILTAPAAHAQPAADQSAAVVNAALDTAAVVAQPFIVGLAAKHPWLVSLLAVVATLRLVFKPIMSAVEAYVKSTPSATDDEWVAKAQHSPAFRAFAWVLDYLGSIKVGPRLPERPPATPPPAA